MNVRFFDRGGHDAGTGKFEEQAGRVVEVTKMRFAEIKDDSDKLRSPYGNPLSWDAWGRSNWTPQLEG